MLDKYHLDPTVLDKVFYLDETTIDLNWCPGTHTVVINPILHALYDKTWSFKVSRILNWDGTLFKYFLNLGYENIFVFLP